MKRSEAARRQRLRSRRRGRIALAALALVALVASVEDPARVMTEPRSETVYVVDYGLHTGLALRRPPFTARGLFLDLPPSDWLEIGWGDERFYRETAEITDFRIWTGLRAILGLGDTALHVVALPGPPETVFRADALTTLRVDRGGVDALVRHVAASLARPARQTADGHWPGVSAFYRSRLRYGPTRLCNHWTARALNTAGAPVSGLWSTLPATMRWELRLRGAIG